MTALASVTTAKGACAIANIILFDDDNGSEVRARDIIETVFRPVGKKEAEYRTGTILLGDIVDGQQTIDQVVLGCEDQNLFSIHCHGNPIIVEMIMKLLASNGVRPVGIEKVLENKFTIESANSIEAEAKLEQLKAVTLQGVKIITAQPTCGLAKTAENWLEQIESIPLKNLQTNCKQILKASQSAKYIIAGCKVAIAGPPNSGKSTLLNCLTGREKAIVTDIAGTTRDWVSATCRMEGLLLELFDTAGVDENLAGKDAVDKESQRRALELMRDCDLVLFLRDATQKVALPDEQWIGGKKIISVENKCDLIVEAEAPKPKDSHVRISAKYEKGIEELLKKIETTMGIDSFDQTQAICFTERQLKLVRELSIANDRAKAKSLITELLNGKIKKS